MLGEHKDKSGMNRLLSTSICLRNKVINVLTGTERLFNRHCCSLSFLHVKCFCCTCDSLPFLIWHRFHLETGQLINYRWELADKDPACPLRLFPPEVPSGIAPQLLINTLPSLPCFFFHYLTGVSGITCPLNLCFWKSQI